MKIIRIFILAAGGVLLLAALNRFMIVASPAQALALPEPLLGIPLRYAVLLVGLLELSGALICLFGRGTGFQLAWLAWLATGFLAWQIGVRLTHVHPQGTCLGVLTDPLHLARGLIGYVTFSLPFCLLVGSYGAGGWVTLSKTSRHARRQSMVEQAEARDAAEGSLKMSCPACGGHVKFAGQNAGQQIPCPHCRAAITLLAPGSLKMSCVLCDGHIEFPAHALGAKIPCPHCAKTITLLNQAQTS